MRKLFAFILCISILFVSAFTPVWAITTGVDDAVHDDLLEILSPTRRVDDNAFDVDSLFEENARVTLGTGSAIPGSTVTVPLTLEKNSGFATMVLRVSYDSTALKLTAVNSTLDVSFTEKGGFAVITFSNTELDEEEKPVNFTGVGEIARLTFSTKDASGVYTVSVDDKSQLFAYGGRVLNTTFISGEIILQCDHNYSGEYIVVKEAGCETEGAKYRVCSVCNHKNVEAIPATGHDEGTWYVYRPADCINGGVEARLCNKCDKAIEMRKTEAIGHSLAWAVEKAPTCTEEGILTHMCIICGGEKGESHAISMTDHIAGEEKVIKEPSCGEEGVLAVICKNCPAVISTTPIAKKEHEKTKLYVVTPPTSSENGYGEYRCTVCGEVTKTVDFDKTESVIKGSGNTVAYIGKTVRIPVVVEKTEGFYYGVVRAKYDADSLTFLSCQAGDVTQDIMVGSAVDGELSILICPQDDEIRKNGVLFYLEFAVNENAEDTVIDLYYDADGDFSDKKGDRVFFNFEDINVTVRESRPGDVNGDDLIDTTDLALLKLYLVDARDTVKSGADIDFDKTIGANDLALLKLYLAGCILLE